MYVHIVIYTMINPTLIGDNLFLSVMFAVVEFKSITALEVDDVSIVVFSRRSSGGFQVYYRNLDSLHNSPFDPLLQTKFVIHGFQSGCNDEIFIVIRDAYLSKADFNVICVDWSYMAKTSYMEAIENVWFVGQFLGRFIDWMIYESGLRVEDIHIIGHSLGAHVAGIAGHNLKMGLIERITGLDPAVPFINFDSDKSLDRYDAGTVEIIFTSTLSYGHPLGDVNYFINGGLEQPGCDRYTIKRIGSLFSGSIVCSHSRAFEIFATSIKFPGVYVAFQCDDVVQAMAMNCHKELNLQFLTTTVREGIFSVTN